MHLRYGLLADAVAPGAQGKKNIIGTFTTIYSPDFPCQHPSLSLAIRIEGHLAELGQHDLELVFVDADFNPIGRPLGGKFDLKKEQIPVEGIPPSLEVVMTCQNLLIPKPGPYEFVVRVDGRHLGSIPLYAVKIVPQQPSS